MASLSLVVLAAGLGRRFGGVKQLAQVGPSGEAIFDYSASDASRAGFDRVVLVVRSEILGLVSEHVARHWPSGLDTRIVCQDRDELGERASARGRAIPLGTAHAVLAGAKAAGDRPFVVINADDLYGSEPYRLLAAQLTRERDCALVTFPVANTLLGPGTVSRALCDVGAGMLRSIEEGTVTSASAGLVWQGITGRRVTLDGSEPVSMNCWGFRPDAAVAFADATERFVASDRVATTDEVLIPDVVRTLAANGVRFAALPASGHCVGVTHASDLDAVRQIVSTPAW